MPPGKPFPKVTAEQRAAFGHELKKDGLNLLKDLGHATVDHMRKNPQSTISQTVVAAERDFGFITLLSRAVQTARRESAQANVGQQASTAPGPREPNVVDAEFVDEEPKK